MPEFPFYRLTTIGWANPLLRPTVELLRTPPAEVTVDLSTVTFVDSFGVTYLAACVHRCLDAGSQVSIRVPRDQGVSSYLRDIGFYESIGIGEYFPARRPSPHRVDLAHITALAPGFIDYLLDFLEQYQMLAEGLRPSIRLALMELVQNFAEHSGSESGAWVCGQFHPYSKETKSPRVTLCILDLGRGIATALRGVQKFSRKTDSELVELSTLEGVSSVAKNRGRGLSTIRQIARANGGTMTIVSGEARVRFRPDRQAEQLRCLDHSFPGSAVYLSLVPTQRGLFAI